MAAPSAPASAAFDLAILEQFPAMVWLDGLKMERFFLNRFALDFIGRPAPSKRQKGWAKELLHPQDRDRYQTQYRQAFVRREPLWIEYRVRRHDGEFRWVSERSAPLHDARGAFVGYCGFCNDITGRKATAQERERFAQILETTTDIVGMAHPNGDLIYLNQAGRNLAGWPAEGTIEDQNLTALHSGWANEIIVNEGLPRAMAERVWSGETALVNAHGDEVPVLQVLLAHPGTDGQIEFVSTILRDISERKRAEVARIEAANRYEAAVRASGQVLIDWNFYTNEITYGGGLEQCLGYAVEELNGRVERFRDLIANEDRAAFDEEVARVTATRDPFRLLCRIRHKEGRILIAELNGYFFLDREGRLGRMVGFLADITEQRQAQESLTLAHHHLEQRVAERTAELAQANTLINDRAHRQEAVARLGHFALAGAPLPDIFRQSTEVIRETLKLEFCAFFQPTETQDALGAVASAGWPEALLAEPVPLGEESQEGYTLLSGQPVIVDDLVKETRFRLPDSTRQLGARSAVSVVVRAGEKPVGVLIARALHARQFTLDDVYFLQAVGNVLTAAIDRHLAEASIRQAHEEAQAANRAKSEFLSRMSHELRTPLNAILGFSQVLEMDAPSASQRESIAYITRAGAHLLALINQVLDIARIDTGRLALIHEPIALDELLRETASLIEPLAQRSGISVKLDPASPAGLCARADRERLRQVFLNLLSNAVKYNRPQGSVSVSWQSLGDRVRILIGDTGPGLPPEKMAGLFVPFERLGAELTDVEGTGVGLALAQRIVTSLDGQLTATSVRGEGSTFCVELPAAGQIFSTAAASPNPPPPPAPAPPVLRTILYVEDQDLNLHLVERILRSYPHLQLIPATQGAVGLELAREHRPDLILLDLNLPDLPGTEVLRRLKADPALRAIPVIMVSGDAMEERITGLLELGAHGYLSKPYRVQEFLAVIDEALALLPE